MENQAKSEATCIPSIIRQQRFQASIVRDAAVLFGNDKFFTCGPAKTEPFAACVGVGATANAHAILALIELSHILLREFRVWKKGRLAKNGEGAGRRDTESEEDEARYETLHVEPDISWVVTTGRLVLTFGRMNDALDKKKVCELRKRVVAVGRGRVMNEWG